MKRFLAFLLVVLLLTATAAAAPSVGQTPGILDAGFQGDGALVSVQVPENFSGSIILASYSTDGQLLCTDTQPVPAASAGKPIRGHLDRCADLSRIKVFFCAEDHSPLYVPAQPQVQPPAALDVVPMVKLYTHRDLQPVESVKPYAQYRDQGFVMTTDLSDAPGLVYSLTFSDQVQLQKPPAGYNQQALLQWGKDPGLDVSLLHSMGYTGEGAVIAYIDQPVPSHYRSTFPAGKLHYDNSMTRDDYDNSMHGPAVLSFLADREMGTAPDAEIYYYSNPAWLADQSTHAACLRAVLQENTRLPEGKKITMVGFSDNIDETEQNAQAFRDATAACQQAGIMVWFCGEYGAGTFVPMSDKNNPENFLSCPWAGSGFRPELVYVPAGGRTSRGTTETQVHDIYWSDGGLSWTMPYMLGLYGMMAEIDPTLTQEDIRTIVRETAQVNSAGLPIVNPVGLIAAALDRAGRVQEAQQLRQARQQSRSYIYALFNSNAMDAADLNAMSDYLAHLTQGQVLLVDVRDFSDAPSLLDALRAHAATLPGSVAGIQIFGTADMVPAFHLEYQVQMPQGVDRKAPLLSDYFYSNFSNSSSSLTESYNILDHFSQGWNVDLKPRWPVVRLPLERGTFERFLSGYSRFAQDTGLEKLPLVNFSSPIFASANPQDDMGTFLNRMHQEGLLDDAYQLYGNLMGSYPVPNQVLGDVTTENLQQVNQNDVVELLINAHGQRDNIDHLWFQNGQEKHCSLVNLGNIHSVLGQHPYYLDCWTNLSGEGMAQNLITEALQGLCCGAFGSTSILSNNGVNCFASQEALLQSNFYYFYQQYLLERNQGVSRSRAFFLAQQRYADALLADSRLPLRGEGNYQFQLYNLLSYENFGVLEPSVPAQVLYTITAAVPGQDPQNRLPSGSSYACSYQKDGDWSQGDVQIHHLSAQKFTDGSLDVTLSYTAPEAWNLLIFNPPSGDLLRLEVPAATGQPQDVTFTLSEVQQQTIGEVTFSFWGENTDNLFLFTHMENLCHPQPSQPARRSSMTNGVPVGDAWTVTNFQTDIPVDTAYQFHGVTAQALDNDYIRVTVDYTGVAGMYINAFSPPNGKLYMLDGGQVSDQRALFSFDLTPDEINAEFTTVSFYGDVAERAFLYLSPGAILENQPIS